MIQNFKTSAKKDEARSSFKSPSCFYLGLPESFAPCQRNFKHEKIDEVGRPEEAGDRVSLGPPMEFAR